jgi:protein-S-isoprenylcysteine O-methyltransferase Ste14
LSSTVLPQKPRSRRFGIRLEALQWLLLALLSMVVLHVFVPLGRIVPRELFWGGVVIGLAGLLLSNLASMRLRRAGTVLETDLTPGVLVTDGEFAMSRNPVYLGMLLLLGGEAMMLGTVGALLPWPAMWLLLRFKFIRQEERVLHDTFGERYAHYRSRVRRWL